MGKEASQEKRILAYLKAGFILTADTALRVFGSKRYQARISRLRKQGALIETLDTDPVSYKYGRMKLAQRRFGKPNSKRVLAYMLRGGRLTESEALGLFGCAHLASTVCYLRHNGWAIYNTIETSVDGRSHYARYYCP